MILLLSSRNPSLIMSVSRFVTIYWLMFYSPTNGPSCMALSLKFHSFIHSFIIVNTHIVIVTYCALVHAIDVIWCYLNSIVHFQLTSDD